MVTAGWWVLFLPFISFLAIPLLPETKRAWAGWIALGAILTAFALSLYIASHVLLGHAIAPVESTLSWIVLPAIRLEFGILLDRLSALMLLIVTGIGSGIFLYSMEYMKDDPGYRRYFASLSIFTFSMTGIVLSSNLLQLFIFWELVGLSSYLLIGHWYQKPEAAEASKKAFLTNRVGDFGFMIGLLALWTLSGPAGARTLNIPLLSFQAPQIVQASAGASIGLALAMLLIFMGVMGKSAQFPLHVWLPDAMEGPTPVSALIHAATMVAAGVYLLARTFFLFALAPKALVIIAVLGGFTALFAATQALVQNDLKRILAYSTLSQLGYMVMAVGLGSSGAAMYHLTTHAFFKALLFLAVGSVIHATHEQNIFKMGGLIKPMPITSMVFFIGSIALMGFWPMSGFFSKEEILALAFEQSKVLFGMSIFTAFLTSLYMGRAISVAFLSKSHGKHHAHEPGLKMLLPLILLAVLSVVSGYVGLGHLVTHKMDHHIHHHHFLPYLTHILGALGFFIGWSFYRLKESDRTKALANWAWLRELLVRKYYMDDLYDFIVQNVQQPFARLLAWCEDRLIVEGAVGGSAHATGKAGDLLRRLQTGNIQHYLALFLVGVISIVFFFGVK